MLRASATSVLLGGLALAVAWLVPGSLTIWHLLVIPVAYGAAFGVAAGRVHRLSARDAARVAAATGAVGFMAFMTLARDQEGEQLMNLFPTLFNLLVLGPVVVAVAAGAAAGCAALSSRGDPA